MVELISKKKIVDIVDNAGYNAGLQDGFVSVSKIKEVIAESIYKSINAINNEAILNQTSNKD